jgi:hypothetical protein
MSMDCKCDIEYRDPKCYKHGDNPKAAQKIDKKVTE